MHTTDRDDRFRSTFESRTTNLLLLWGLAVWFVVAVLIRFAGHVLLDPAAPLIVGGFFASVLPLMGLVTYPIYGWLDVVPEARPTAAALMSLPGMFLDVVLIVAAGTLLPEMAPGAVINFGAILLFGYAVVLCTGFVHLSR